MCFYICYKITNKINSKVYVGVHKTDNINDGYMGSGVAIKKAISKYRIENFKKEILKEFNSVEEMLYYEKSIVNKEFVESRNTYNLTIGGGEGCWSIQPTYNMLACKDVYDNIFHISKNDPRYISGELTHVASGKVVVRTTNGDTLQVDVNDPRYLSGELKFISKGTVNVRDMYGNTFRVDIKDPRYLSGELVTANKNIKKSTFIAVVDGDKKRISFDDPRYLSGEIQNSRIGKVCAKYKDENIIVDINDPRFKTGELEHINKNKLTVINKNDGTKVRIDKSEFDDKLYEMIGVGKITCFDCNGNKFRVSVDDPRYLSGELIAKTTKNQITVRDKNGNTFNILKDDPRYLSGELKSVNSGTITINNGKEMKRIPKDSDIPIGWVRGMIKRIL